MIPPLRVVTSSKDLVKFSPLKFFGALKLGEETTGPIENDVR